MTNVEAAAEIRRAVSDKSRGHFSWPTDGCGYAQHMLFVDHRNRKWEGGDRATWDAFVLAYAASLELADDTVVQ